MLLTVLTPSRLNPIADVFGPRSIAAVRVLRISVTDRCNLRCVYCMPTQGVRWLPQKHLLTDDEIVEVVSAAVSVHGIRRFKLSGGEPTVRPQLVQLVQKLRNVSGVDELSMTSNGMLLAPIARPLADAGMDRVTLSLDSLRPDRFTRITRGGDIATLFRAIEAVERSGMRNLKLNVVAMRAVNDDEFADFARLSVANNLTVRFIEFMPLGDAAIMHADPISVSASEQGPAGGCGARQRDDAALVVESEIRSRIEQQLGSLIPINRDAESGVGPSVVYRLAKGNPRGRIGFISAMSKPFCDSCNRLRLTADGILRSCLFDGGEVDVRGILRPSRNRSARKHAISRAMADCVRLKPQMHTAHGDAPMSRIGG
ncbi:GTP 3',8-cyclase MoaA [soil metagenome]